MTNISLSQYLAWLCLLAWQPPRGKPSFQVTTVQSQGLYFQGQTGSLHSPFSLHAKQLQSCPTLHHSIDCSLPGSPVHGILQARILEWVAMPSAKGSSWPRHRTCVSLSFWTCISCVGRRFLAYFPFFLQLPPPILNPVELFPFLIFTAEDKSPGFFFLYHLHEKRKLFALQVMITRAGDK